MYELVKDVIKKQKIFRYELLANAIAHSRLVNDIKARRLATNNKRLDVCAAEIAHQLHLIPEITIQDKVCLEIGCGWILSYALIYYLLGAKKVITTDILPMANPARLYDALHHSTAYVIRDVLSAYVDRETIREKLDYLLSLKHFDFETLSKIGIEYVAPFDFAKSNYSEKADIIYSRSVMNHLPRSIVKDILKNLYDTLNSGGAMMHDIHLEDIKAEDNPFAFYEIPETEYPLEYDTVRGNRIRASQWEEYFDDLSSNKSRVYYRWIREDNILPSNIDSSIKYKDSQDLLTTHIGILAHHD